jgi:hypothetical protein
MNEFATKLMVRSHVTEIQIGQKDATGANSGWEVSVVNQLEELDLWASIWDKLLEQNATRSYFLRYSWSRLWLLHLAPPGYVLFVLLVKDNAGEVQGLAPFYIASKRHAQCIVVRELLFIGTGSSIKTSEHLDILAKPGSEVRVANTLAEFLLQCCDWQRMFLWSVPERSATLHVLQVAMQGRLSECDRPHVVPTAGNWTDVRAAWSPKFRRNLQRNTDLLAKQPNSHFRRVIDRNELAARFDDFVRLHQMRWIGKGQRGSFANIAFAKFFLAAVFDAFDHDLLWFWCYEHDGICVATLVAFLDNGVVHYFQSGFDPKYARFSLGSVMIAHCLQECVADAKIREFDFMGGGAAYKDAWTTQTRTALQLECFRLRRVAMLYRTIETLRRSVRILKHMLR